MNFYEYTDFLFRKANQDLQKTYTTNNDGLAKCSSMLIHGQRVFYKWLHVPIVIVSYFAIKFNAPIASRQHFLEFKEKEAERIKALEEAKKPKLVPAADESHNAS